MSTIDEIGRRAGQDALADAAAATDVEAGLARLLADADSEPRSRGRRWTVVAAVATVAAAVIALIVVMPNEGPEPVTPVAPAPSTTTVVTTAPTTSAPTTTIAPVDDGLSVSYLSPPPVLSPEPFATVELADASTVAVAPDGAVVVADRSTGEAIVVAPDGSQRRVALDVTPGGLVAAGPGDVVYGLWYPEVMPPEASIVAIALSGDRAGQVVASSPVDPNRFIEAPIGALGLGPTGVVDRYREVGAEILGYLDTAGQPISWPGTPPPVVTADGDTVRSSNGTTWPLRIARHPEWQGDSYTGESPPAPAAGGGATLWTSLGPPAAEGDFPPPTMRVVAELAADGTGTWHLLPADWTVAASDVGGTILVRQDGNQLQLARL